MDKLRQHIKSNQILYQMIGGFALLSLLILPIMSALFYQTFQKALQKEIFQAQQQNLQQMTNTVDFRAEYASFLMQTAKQDPEISKLFYQKGDQQALTALSRLRMSVKQLHSIYIYNEAEDAVYCSSGQNQYSVSNLREFEDSAFAEMISSIDQYQKYTPFLRRAEQEKPNGQKVEEWVYTYLLFDTFSNGTVKNIMAFNFHLDWMGDALEFIRDGDDKDNKIQIIDQHGQIVYSDTGELIGSYVDIDSLPTDVYTQPVGYEILGSGNDKRMVVYATPTHSGYAQWTFLAWSNYSQLVKSMNQLRKAVALGSVAALFVMLLLITLLSGRIYLPVKKTIDRVDSLQAEQKKKLAMERTLFLRNLFKGELPEVPSKIEELLRQHEIRLDVEQKVCVLLVSVDHLNAYLYRFVKKLTAMDERIEAVLHSRVDPLSPCAVFVKMQDGIWGVCLPMEHLPQGDWLTPLFEEINRDLSEPEELTVSVALSGLSGSVSDVPYLYAEAVNMMSFRFLLGQNVILTKERVRDLGKESYRYPLEVEKALVSAIFSGKPEEANAVYGQFVESISGFAVFDMRIAFMLLANAIKRASLNTIAEVAPPLLEMDKLYQKLQTLETIEETNRLFLALIAMLTEKTQDYALKKHKDTIGRMKAYVADNYGSLSLSMNEVAEHMDMSAAYLGRLFKQVEDCTFTEYLTDFRLKKACDALLHTSKTVNDISDEVGFTNSSYFYIVFKKKLGCTPSQYRKQAAAED